MPVKSKTATSNAAGKKPAAAARKTFNPAGMKKSTSPNKTPNGKKRRSRNSADDVWKVSLFHGVHQKGPMMGKPSGNVYLICKSKYDDNEEFKRLMQEHFDISPKWSKDRKGFAIKVNSAQQAQDIHTVCRSINNASRDLGETLDTNGWVGAMVEIIKLTDLNVVMYTGSYTNAEAIMLNCDASLYDLKDMLFDEKFEYIRGINGMEGVDRYLRILEAGEEESVIAKVEEI
jgi:hypothetical protein